MHTSIRRLPHLYVIGEPLFVTCCLHGSLPAARKFTNDSLTSGQAFVCMDKLLDHARTGPMYLKMPDVAHLVADAIHRGGESDYVLHAWVIMSNDVHLLFTPKMNVTKIMQRLKGSTAREANRLLARTGRFWQEESYDRLVRNAEEFRKIKRYILWNPVKAGLASTPEEFPWSSAYSLGGLKPAAG